MLSGIIPPLPTPMTSDERLDVSALRRLVAYELAGGVHGVWVLGTTGRFDLVADEDQRTTAEIVCDAVSGRIPVVVHVSDLGTRRTLRKAARFDDLPVAAYAVMPPWFERYEREELLDHFRCLADGLARPLVIYSAEWICNLLSPDDVRELAQHPRIIGIKDTNPDFRRWRSWPSRERRSCGFSHLYGTDEIAGAAEAGADGVVTGLAGVVPGLAVAAWTAAKAGHRAGARELQEQFGSAKRALEVGPVMVCLEAAFQWLGLCQFISGAPQRTANASVRRKVGGFLRAAQLEPASSGVLTT